MTDLFLTLNSLPSQILFTTSPIRYCSYKLWKSSILDFRSLFDFQSFSKRILDETDLSFMGVVDLDHLHTKHKLIHYSQWLYKKKVLKIFYTPLKVYYSRSIYSDIFIFVLIQKRSCFSYNFILSIKRFTSFEGWSKHKMYKTSGDVHF